MDPKFTRIREEISSVKDYYGDITKYLKTLTPKVSTRATNSNNNTNLLDTTLAYINVANSVFQCFESFVDQNESNLIQKITESVKSALSPTQTQPRRYASVARGQPDCQVESERHLPSPNRTPPNNNNKTIIIATRNPETLSPAAVQAETTILLNKRNLANNKFHKTNI